MLAHEPRAHPQRFQPKGNEPESISAPECSVVGAKHRALHDPLRPGQQPLIPRAFALKRGFRQSEGCLLYP